MAMTRRKRETLAALGFLLPNFLGFFLFVAFPVLFSAMLVVTNWSLKPAIETRFLGLENVWRLVGFRPIADANPSGGIMWLLIFLGGYAAVFSGILAALSDLGRKTPGLRLGGCAGVAAAIVLFAAGLFTHVGASAILNGVMLLFGSFFLLTDEDGAFAGKAVRGPLLIVAGIAMVYLFRDAALARWEPLDVNFYRYLYNTLYLMVIIPIQIAGSLALALILSQPLLKTHSSARWIVTTIFALVGLAGGALIWFVYHPDLAVLWTLFWSIAALGIGGGVFAFRTLFYIPTFTAGIAVMLLWKQMFNPNFGPINEGIRLVFRALGIDAEAPRWLGDPDWAKPAIMLMGFWMVVGGQNMLLYLAGLANIAPDLYEAASIDGANKRQMFWNVTWPQLAPTTFFIMIMSTIAGLQGGFEQARVLTNGGPAGSTKTLAFYVYEKAFEELQLGYASAIAWVLFLMVFVLTALNWRFGNRYVNY